MQSNDARDALVSSCAVGAIRASGRPDESRFLPGSDVSIDTYTWRALALVERDEEIVARLEKPGSGVAIWWNLRFDRGDLFAAFPPDGSLSSSAGLSQPIQSVKPTRAARTRMAAKKAILSKFPEGVPSELSNKRLVSAVSDTFPTNQAPSSDTILRAAGRKK